MVKRYNPAHMTEAFNGGWVRGSDYDALWDVLREIADMESISDFSFTASRMRRLARRAIRTNSNESGSTRKYLRKG